MAYCGFVLVDTHFNGYRTCLDNRLAWGPSYRIQSIRSRNGGVKAEEEERAWHYLPLLTGIPFLGVLLAILLFV
ncbi:hypothetical protein GQ53DRAFT_755893 [Thozetella sp. PMI_491]|nr:hypothetical protein GQ53DRAFT_755893 [Thozetella sp. PMI_491]